MATSSSEKLMTAENLLGLPDDGTQYEVDRGRPISMSPASAVSSMAAVTVVFHPGAAPITLDSDAALDGVDGLFDFKLPLPEPWAVIDGDGGQN
jgi:hypothetical protein